MRLATCLLSVLVLAACGESARESACSVLDNGDGTQTIRCGAQSVTVPGSGDGTTCVKSPAADGGAVIACTDGTTIVLDRDGNVVHRGAGGVVGRVTLFDPPPGGHAGTQVRAVGTERVAVTDEKGDFYLSGLDAGVYDLMIERQGWEPIRLRNTIAVGGILYLEPVVLRRGRWIGSYSAGGVVSAREDTLLVREDRALWLHFVDRIAPVELSPDSATFWDFQMQARYEADGAAVLFFEGIDPVSEAGRLRRYELATGAFATLAERACRAEPLPGGPVLIWRVPEDAEPGAPEEAEVVVRYPDGAVVPVLRLPWLAAVNLDVQVPPGGEAVSLLQYSDVGWEPMTSWVVDIAARSSFSVAGVYVRAWSPDGRKALLRPAAETGPLLLLDVATQEQVLLSADAHWDVSFSPDGGKVLFLDNYDPSSEQIGDLTVVDTRTFTRVVSPNTERTYAGWRFTPDGAAVLYQRGGQSGRLEHWDFARDRATSLGTASIESVVFSPRGDRFAFVDLVGENTVPGQASNCRLVRLEADGNPAIFITLRCEAVHFLPDGERTALLLWNDEAEREIRLWDGGEPGPAVVDDMPGDPGVDRGIRFAEDGSAVLWKEVGVGGTVVHVRGLVDGTIGELPGSSGYSLAEFSPDGDFAIGHSDSAGELRVLERATGAVVNVDQPVAPVGIHRNFVLYVIAEAEGQERPGLYLARYPRTPAE